MHENDYDWNGFRWVALDDYQNSVIAFRRIANDSSEILVVCNFQPVTREHYMVGAPVYGIYEEVFNSEAVEFGGTGIGNPGDLKTKNEKNHDCDFALELTLPPLGVCYYKLKQELPAPKKRGRKKKDEAEGDEAKKTTKRKATVKRVTKKAKAEAPKAEAPKAEAPKEETPKAEEPKAEE